MAALQRLIPEILHMDARWVRVKSVPRCYECLGAAGLLVWPCDGEAPELPARAPIDVHVNTDICWGVFPLDPLRRAIVLTASGQPWQCGIVDEDRAQSCYKITKKWNYKISLELLSGLRLSITIDSNCFAAKYVKMTIVTKH
eukprot:2036393-Amphidinium_carterae.1